MWNGRSWLVQSTKSEARNKLKFLNISILQTLIDHAFMDSPPQKKRYDLEERTAAFAAAVRRLAKRIRLTALNTDDIKQLVRASGSVAANYVEANDSLGKKDFAMRIKICRKESKESWLWLRLLEVAEDQESQRLVLIQESRELMCIFGAILKKCES